MYLDHKAGYVL